MSKWAKRATKPKYHLSISDKRRIIEICDKMKKTSSRKCAECASSVLEISVTHTTVLSLLKNRKEIEECKAGKAGEFMVKPKKEIDHIFDAQLEQKLLIIHRYCQATSTNR